MQLTFALNLCLMLGINFFLLKILVEFVMGICQISNLTFVGLSFGLSSVEFDLYMCEWNWIIKLDFLWLN
jgi:hypothetical protein